MTGELADKKIKVECPNCKRSISAVMHSNRWVKWIDVNCWTCGYHYTMKDIYFDYVQPSSPFFELIYGKYVDKTKLAKETHTKNRKEFEEGREERLWNKKKLGKLKDSELKEIKSYIKSRGI